MEVGKKIKYLRLKKGATQEQLANYLNIAPQSVSKWENQISLPDIMLLPTLSAFLGVTIDELFDLTDEAKLERIENMLEKEVQLSEESFQEAENFLKMKKGDALYAGKAYGLLAELYNHKADEYRQYAEHHAKKALQLEPTHKTHHCNLQRAQEGTIADWDYGNHNDRIHFYQDFVQRHPDYRGGYLWLLDELITDNRLKEAKVYLQKLSLIDESCRVPYYEGKIALKEGKVEQAKQVWRGMVTTHVEDWLTHLCMGNAMVSIGAYEEAITAFNKAYDLQPSPKYTDAFWSIAQIHEMQGDYKEAIEALEKKLEVLKVEWMDEESREVEKTRQVIKQLKER